MATLTFGSTVLLLFIKILNVVHLFSKATVVTVHANTIVVNVGTFRLGRSYWAGISLVYDSDCPNGLYFDNA